MTITQWGDAPNRTQLAVASSGSGPLAMLARVDEAWPGLPLEGLGRVEAALADLVRTGPLSGPHLLTARRGLGLCGIDMPLALGGEERSSLDQALVQFIAGAVDLDLRDVAHAAHARLPLLYGTKALEERWSRALVREGGLAAVMATEPTGGTALHAMRTSLSDAGRGRYDLHGTKQFVSRACEAVCSTVFARDGYGRMVAACIPADRDGVSIERLQPDGLSGWSWSKVTFEHVAVKREELIPNARVAWERHFEYYRPQVAACVLGAAWTYWELARNAARERLAAGTIRRARDTTLVALGETEVEIRCALLEVLHTVVAVESQTPSANLMSRASKAAAVKTAIAAVDRLAPILGAYGFQADSRAAKVARDIRGYKYADGLGVELLRSAGKLHLEPRIVACRRQTLGDQSVKSC
jgi:alkylation response protein AidB-like acyl-CoA dehydrogenase